MRAGQPRPDGTPHDFRCGHPALPCICDDPVPRCLRCGCRSTDHAVDDEELRECLGCECTQWEGLDLATLAAEALRWENP